jgi:hypothetical protein
VRSSSRTLIKLSLTLPSPYITHSTAPHTLPPQQQQNSAYTCPNEDHRGPSTSNGRGAPEIDILEAEKDKLATTGQVVSQSAQFAPFRRDYLYLNATEDEWKVFDAGRSRPNVYKGSAV